MSDYRFLRALRRQPVDKTPIWIMRQAGRYLPEYRESRARAGSFLGLAKNPEAACEVTLQPLARFDLDAAILFSDILMIPDAMGLGLHFVEGEGPKFHHPIRSAADVARLPIPDPETELRYVPDAVRLIRRELDGRVPLIGFAGSPWTVGCYMIQGGSSPTFPDAKAMMWSAPDVLHQLLDKVARSTITYLQAQAAAGAQALMVFDSWGGMLGPQQFHDFSLRYLRIIAEGLQADANSRDVPLILFSKGANAHLEALADTGCAALGVDWTISVGDARKRVGDHVAVQGNMDPSVLKAPPEVIRAQARTILDSFGAHPGHVFNLGHGITPDIDPEHVAVLVDAVHSISAEYHAKS